MYYHASQTKGIKELEPRISNHNKPLIYFSDIYIKLNIVNGDHMGLIKME